MISGDTRRRTCRGRVFRVPKWLPSDSSVTSSGAAPRNDYYEIASGPRSKTRAFAVDGSLTSFVHERFCRRRCLRSRRDREREPDVPAVRPVLGRELPVGFQVEISLQVPDGKEVADLRAKTDDARLKTADAVSGPAVTADLLIEVADNTNKKLFR